MGHPLTAIQMIAILYAIPIVHQIFVKILQNGIKGYTVGQRNYFTKIFRTLGEGQLSVALPQ